ncbi:cysteine desulfurase family protein [Aquipuribacter nitratireducens]|uniref:Cysteine desulfurase family protein n=1 Tax=Aquipuribacter nitratireducens TaxID=650104 RepID=A0ABW0GK37_9MICO
MTSGTTSDPVDLDTATAAPPLPVAVDAWRVALDDAWADERGLHGTGARARLVLGQVRSALAELVGDPGALVGLPPDHVRALHAAVLGCSAPTAAADGPVVVSAVEHSAVHHAARFSGQVREVAVDRDGRVDLDALADALPGARLACVQQANQEIGTLQDLEAVHALCRREGVPLLVDAGASLGHVPVPGAWDVLVGSPRAWGSVPGAALLVLRPGVRWRRSGPGEAGASQRPGEHPGTVDVPAALAAAVSLQSLQAGPLGDADPRHALVARLRERVAEVPGTDVVGSAGHRLPHVLTVSALYVPGEELVRRLDAVGFRVGSGSACTADTLRPSHVLAAVGALTHGNVRVAVPRGTDPAVLDRFAPALAEVVAELRRELGAESL